MEITLTLPDELAARLRPMQPHLPEILQLGLREWTAQQGGGFAGLTDVMKTLASLPTPQEVLILRPSAALQERLDELLEKHQSGTWTVAEQQEWDQYQYVEHLVRLAKANAALKLQTA